jgi:27-O-demethylrifamycin SV methyltransferase
MGTSGETSHLLDAHYHRALENFAFVSAENLHLVGYFESEQDTLPTALRNLNRLVTENARVTASDLVLDVGCGSGGPACYLAETVGCGVIGIDLGDAQLNQARRLIEAKGLTHRVKFYRQDGTQTSFKSQQFDAVLMMGSASNISSKERLFAECARVSKAGARLILGDGIIVNPQWFDDPRNVAIAKVIKVFFGSPFLESLDGYLHLLQSHGFQMQDMQDLSQHVIRSCELWLVTLDENRLELVKQLGAGRYRALAKGIKMSGEIARQGHVGCVIIRAIRQNQ